jgi:hypothetical protein
MRRRINKVLFIMRKAQHCKLVFHTSTIKYTVDADKTTRLVTRLTIAMIGWPSINTWLEFTDIHSLSNFPSSKIRHPCLCSLCSVTAADLSLRINGVVGQYSGMPRSSRAPATAKYLKESQILPASYRSTITNNTRFSFSHLNPEKFSKA